MRPEIRAKAIVAGTARKLSRQIDMVIAPEPTTALVTGLALLALSYLTSYFRD